MYTLKIHWWRHVTDAAGVGGIVDETTLFVPADEVRVQGHVSPDLHEMKAWDPAEYQDYLASFETPETGEKLAGRVIERRHDGTTTWYLASKAWLLGPDGKTIERVA